MSEKKRMPCRVCGKLFEPCVTCQTYNDMFRWRNFACSRECAEKYISETIAYRNLLKQNKNGDIVESVPESESTIDSNNATRKRNYKKKSVSNAEDTKIESEQID